MHPQVLLDVVQDALGLVAGRLDDLDRIACNRLLHRGRPFLCCPTGGILLQQDEVGHRFNGHQTGLRMKRLILADCDLFWLHPFRQTPFFLMPKRHNSLLHRHTDLLVRTIRSSHKPGQTAQLQKQANQTDATGTHLGHHKMGGKHQAMEELHTGRRLKKCHHLRRCIKGILTLLPMLQRRARDLQLLSYTAMAANGIFLDGLLKLRKRSSHLVSGPAFFPSTLPLSFLLIISHICHALATLISTSACPT